jgi:hypothetical protein
LIDVAHQKKPICDFPVIFVALHSKPATSVGYAGSPLYSEFANLFLCHRQRGVVWSRPRAQASTCDLGPIFPYSTVMKDHPETGNTVKIKSGARNLSPGISTFRFQTESQLKAAPASSEFCRSFRNTVLIEDMFKRGTHL